MITLNITGHPRPQGSKRAFVNPQTGRAIMTESSGKGLSTWRQDVKAEALNTIADLAPWTPYDGPVAVTAIYRFPRPKAHFRTGANAHLLRDQAPTFATSRAVGDIEKIARSTHDALTAAGVWTDDSLVAVLTIQKVYVCNRELPGATITITPLNPVAAPAALVTGSTTGAATAQGALL